MTTEKTFKRTDAEIAETDALHGPAQHALFAAERRTGVRLAMQACKGGANIVAVAYKLNGKGKPVGGATVHMLVSDVPESHIPDAFAELDVRGLA